MPFKKLSECFLFQSINTDARAKIITEMSNKSIVDNYALTKDLMEEHIATISRRYKFQSVGSVLEEYNKGNIVLVNYPKTQIPTFIPCWLTYGSNNKIVAVINASPYIKTQKDVIDIDTKRAFSLLQLGYLNLRAFSTYTKIVNNISVITCLAKIYTKFVMKILDRNYAVNINKVNGDKVSYLIAKFFIINVLGKAENKTVNDIAANCCVNSEATRIQVEQTEDDFTINFENIATFFDADMPSAFPCLKEMTFRQVLESYCKMYGDFNFLSLEYFYNFLSYIMSARVSANLGNDTLAMAIAERDIESAYKLVINVFVGR